MSDGKSLSSALAWRGLLVALTAAIAGFTCATMGTRPATSAGEVLLDREASGSTVTLHPGQRLVVTLPGNPTTGYQWELVTGAEMVLATEGEPQFTRGGSSLGAGGAYRFAFKAVAPGTGRLKLLYRRPFEGDVTPAATFEVTVAVR